MQQVMLGIAGITSVFSPAVVNHASLAKESVVVIQKNIDHNISFESRIFNLRNNPARLVLQDKEFDILLADNNTLRTKGLSGTKSIGENQTMLFVFDKPSIYGFWMKAMLYRIDMVWIGENGKIVHIVESADPRSYPKIFKPSVNSIAVAEFKDGTVRKLGLKVGDQVEFSDR